MRPMFRFPDMFEEMRKMQEDMERLMRKMQPLMLESREGKTDKTKMSQVRQPVTMLKETETHVIADIEIPGMDKEDIQLHVTPHKIEIRAAKKQEVSKKGEYAMSQRSFYRSFSLPAEVDAEHADAVYKNGILHLKLLKIRQGTAKRIQIK